MHQIVVLRVPNNVVFAILDLSEESDSSVTIDVTTQKIKEGVIELACCCFHIFVQYIVKYDIQSMISPFRNKKNVMWTGQPGSNVAFGSLRSRRNNFSQRIRCVGNNKLNALILVSPRVVNVWDVWGLNRHVVGRETMHISDYVYFKRFLQTSP